MGEPNRHKDLREAIDATRRDLGLCEGAPVDPREVLRRHPPIEDLARFVRRLLADDETPAKDRQRP